MDHASGHAMNLSGKSSAQQQQRNSTGGGGSKSMHAQHANSFDVLSTFSVLLQERWKRNQRHSESSQKVCLSPFPLPRSHGRSRLWPQQCQGFTD